MKKKKKILLFQKTVKIVFVFVTVSRQRSCALVHLKRRETFQVGQLLKWTKVGREIKKVRQKLGKCSAENIKVNKEVRVLAVRQRRITNWIKLEFINPLEWNFSPYTSRVSNENGIFEEGFLCVSIKEKWSQQNKKRGLHTPVKNQSE